jgi:plastocyanin
MRVRGSCLLVIVILWGCGGSDAPAPSALPAPSPSPAPSSNEGRVSITPFGLIPFEATVAVGGRVTFTNNDIMPHEIQGGPDPDHRECPEIDKVSFLTPGQSRATDPLPVARTCEYHDHTEQDHHAFVGRIVIK